ncbi:hypothetical protein [Serratia symbiotica]|uniref:Uncharacterized protein n=1 Tax=Serratia symbiotica TaxID=138074 RepID=A0A068YVH5_9GAMM|nr:hypothetical protein [Serratia symbiotica]QLH62276.1 hypothetical protein SYMBAF_04030 [Serratia symbiotica]CDS55692.1 conserved hypothetical protein [Serratia symbiotica]
MCEKVKVVITADSKVYFRKEVEMDKADLDEYENLVNSEQSSKAIENRLTDIAYKYGFSGGGSDILNHCEIKEITFELTRD